MHLLYVTVSLFLYLTVGRVIYRLFCSCVSFLETLCGFFFVCVESKEESSRAAASYYLLLSLITTSQREREKGRRRRRQIMKKVIERVTKWKENKREVREMQQNEFLGMSV